MKFISSVRSAAVNYEIYDLVRRSHMGLLSMRLTERLQFWNGALEGIKSSHLDYMQSVIKPVVI